MKIPIDPPVFCKHLFCYALSLLLSYTLSAQEKFYRNSNDPNKGYWILYTDATSQITNIKFFDASDRLLYEEVIPYKYIKLTDRNINRINQVFDQITSNQKVLAKVKANQIPATPFHDVMQRENARKAQPKSTSNTSSSKIQINSFKILNSTKFYVAFENPDRERINIYLKDEGGQVIHSENVNCARYTRRFNTVGLHKGRYLLLVTTVNRKYKFTKSIEVGPVTPTLVIENTAPHLVSNYK